MNKDGWLKDLGKKDKPKADPKPGKQGVFPDIGLQEPAAEFEPLRTAPLKAQKERTGKAISTRDRPRKRLSTAQAAAKKVERPERKGPRTRHAERLLGIAPGTFDSEAPRGTLVNFKVNDYIMTCLVNAADRAGQTVSEYLIQAALEKARKLGVE